MSSNSIKHLISQEPTGILDLTGLKFPCHSCWEEEAYCLYCVLTYYKSKGNVRMRNFYLRLSRK